jgi:hypothetical protein
MSQVLMVIGLIVAGIAVVSSLVTGVIGVMERRHNAIETAVKMFAIAVAVAAITVGIHWFTDQIATAQ